MGPPCSYEVANLDGEQKHARLRTRKKDWRVCFQGFRWRDQEAGLRHHEDLTTWPLCGFGSMGGDTSKPLAPRDGLQGRCRTMCLTLYGTPTFEMSNARLVGPDPVPNRSDWPARAVCAPREALSIRRRCWCIVVQVLGKKGCPGTPVPDWSVPEKRVGMNATRGISGLGGETTPPLAGPVRPSIAARMGAFPLPRGGFFDKLQWFLDGLHRFWEVPRMRWGSS